jgi:hypothetical protein
VLAAAAVHGGTEPDLLDEVSWWQTDDFWQYALFARWPRFVTSVIHDHCHAVVGPLDYELHGYELLRRTTDARVNVVSTCNEDEQSA